MRVINWERELETNTWHHFVMVYNGNKVVTYKNGAHKEGFITCKLKKHKL